MGKQSKNISKAAKKEDAAGQPPFEISPEEYKDLVDQVAGLSLEEIKEEWILAARYGDLDVVHAILGSPQFQKAHPHPQKQKQKESASTDTSTDTTTDIVNCQDAQNGNTALHMAAANGHTAVVELLLMHPQTKAQHHIVNQAGNTPLHWAAANGHEETVAFLLQNVKDIDVLTKNKFGRSALTEGFTSENTNVVKYILEHDSAAEEKLLQGGKEVDEDGNEIDDNDKQTDSTTMEGTDANTDGKTTAIQQQPHKDDIIHEFEFRILPSSGETNGEGGETNATTKSPTNSLRIRELPIPATQDPFGDRPELDTTGYGIWAASLVMARWMAALSERFHGKRILELGAGCGVPGLSAAYYR